MLDINGFLHRDRLHDLIRRWMLNQPLPGDAAVIPELVHFNSLVVARYLSGLCGELFRALHHVDLDREQALTKGDLKDRIAAALPYRAPRFDELLREYACNPGRYYRETPFHGTLYFSAGGTPPAYLGSSRIKRIRRLAEKSARRLVDRICGGAGAVDAAATVAETAFLEQLRSGQCLRLPEHLPVNDVAGIKVILDSCGTDPLLAVLHRLGCRVIEQERHAGDYSATNLVIEFRPDKSSILARPPGRQLLEILSRQGMDAGEAGRRFAEFVTTAEDTVYVEIIVSSYAEMLESEIGNCMHEERIIRQRRNPLYLGQLAQNVEFLMEYLFTFPAAGRHELGELPVRLWDRYLPDYFEEVRRRLFNRPPVELYEL